MTAPVTRSPAEQASPQLVTAQNLTQIAASLPTVIRSALAYGTRIERGCLTVHLPDGTSYMFRGEKPGPDAVFQVKDFAFARRLALGGDIGFAEAYLRGEWETPNLARFLELFATNYSAIETMLAGKPLARLWQILRHFLNRNTRAGSRKNIHAHYDLGNTFYSSWLDQTMTYSSGIYAPGDNDLSSAQTRKYRALAEQTGIQPGDRVLEIGCGWGGFAEFAAREIGCKVTGLTISKEQFDFAQQRIAKAGLNDKVEIKMLDYRDEKGTYDRIASIEMFEAVGEQYWPIYFQQIRDRLRDGGTAGLQVITIKDESFQFYKNEMDFIRAYIFPGGMLPTPTHMKNLGTKFGVPMVGEREFGLDYAQTLSDWRVRFRLAWPDLTPLGFDERFRRMWEYYLAYCEAGFRSGNIDVRQMVFKRA